MTDRSRGGSIGVRASVSGLMRRRSGTSGRTPAKAFAVLAVALMLAITVVPLVSPDSHTEAAEGVTSVTYHRNQYVNDAETEPVSYNGIVSAEYNPVYNGMGWEAPTATYQYNGTLKISYTGNHNGQTFTLPNTMSVDKDGISYNGNYFSASSTDGRTYTISDSDQRLR